MKKALKFMSCAHSCSSASVVDGKLILSLPNALTPVVWQMDLTQAKASALEVHETKDGFALVLKNPKPETIDIATFKKREDAIDGLMQASNALASAHGQIRPVSDLPHAAILHTAKKPKSIWRFLGIVIGLVVLSALFMIWGSIAPHPPMAMNAAENATSPQASESTPGVPMSADDFLKGR